MLNEQKGELARAQEEVRGAEDARERARWEEETRKEEEVAREVAVAEVATQVAMEVAREMTAEVASEAAAEVAEEKRVAEAQKAPKGFTMPKKAGAGRARPDERPGAARGLPGARAWATQDEREAHKSGGGGGT